MRNRLSVSKSNTRLRRASSWCSAAMRVVKQCKGGSDQNGAIAAAGAATMPPSTQRVPPLASRRRIRNLREEISHLIEAEAMRMSRMRISYRTSEVGDEIGRAFFSSAELILERLEMHSELGSQERQFLMCAIQAVGFALGTESARAEKSNRIRRRAKWVASILSDAMDRNELAILRSDFFGQELLERLSGD